MAAEGRAALDAAGIDHHDDGVDDLGGRWSQIGVSDIAGRERAGSSTWQSLARGTGAVETDYLNGEIVLVGRLHGVPTPVNAALCRLAAEQARGAAAPGELSVDDVLARDRMSSVGPADRRATRPRSRSARRAELAQLVDISSPSGDVPGAEAALALCASLLPPGAVVERPACSTAGSAPDLLGTVDRHRTRPRAAARPRRHRHRPRRAPAAARRRRPPVRHRARPT